MPLGAELASACDRLCGALVRDGCSCCCCCCRCILDEYEEEEHDEAVDDGDGDGDILADELLSGSFFNLNGLALLCPLVLAFGDRISCCLAMLLLGDGCC